MQMIGRYSSTVILRAALGVATIFTAILSGGTARANPIFSLIGTSGTVGDGNLSVAIGQSDGWGFQIFNDSATEWIASNVSDFCPAGVATPPCDANTWFLAGVDTFGPYTDNYGPNFVVVAPGDTVTQLFSSGGAGSIELSRAGINVADSQSGNIVFVYDLYDGDPNGSGSQDGGDQLAYASALVTATTTATTTSSTPEASTFGLFAAGLVATILFRRRRAGRLEY